MSVMTDFELNNLCLQHQVHDYVYIHEHDRDSTLKKPWTGFEPALP